MRFFVSVVMLVVSFALFAGRASAQEVRLCADGKRSYFNVCPEDMQSRPPVVVEPPAKKSTTDTEPTSGIEFVSIPAGSFMMGSLNGDDDKKMCIR